MADMEGKGRWWDPEKERNRVKSAGEADVIEAHYDRIRDWKMDPLGGYFLIRLNRKGLLIEAGYCRKENKVERIIVGKTAMEIFNTIIRENLVGSLQHAADLGAELQKAEIALKENIKYVQDEPLEFSIKEQT